MKPITTAEIIETYCVPENFEVYIAPKDLKFLDEETREHFEGLLEIIRRQTANAAAGMLKGVVKYPIIDESIEYWIENLKSDGHDTLNYAYLLEEKLKRIGILES